ncbi:alpha-L-rhamnosidase-related protein [Saccharobesus litoralis]|nr:esterase [Saccharobesus litoralis]
MLYLRGAFNGWGTANPFQALSANQYRTEIEVTPGNFGFKVATADWSQEWVVNPDAIEIIMLGKAYTLQQHKAPEDALFTAQAGRFEFILDFNHADKPSLVVNKVVRDSGKQKDPHQGRTETLSVDYRTFDNKIHSVVYSVADKQAPLRQFAQSTTAVLRDIGPPYAEYSELADFPRVSTGNLEFDALFALAINEMTYLSVAQINDGNYNAGKSIDCDCFKTGEKWAYVWTRDLAYAADLNLALLDPQRVVNSLKFKTSEFRKDNKVASSVYGKDGLQIIQDTGSGGSWPISTDRVTWAFGAERVLNSLAGDARQAFVLHAFDALRNTIENDRVAAFDPIDGLYTGEQSFLDWREQTYATWIVDDLTYMASSKALSTNVAHYQAIKLTAALAEELNQPHLANKYTTWAKALKVAINQKLWIKEQGLYSSLTAGHFAGLPLNKFDWLGQSLAIMTGIAEPQQATKILSSYPHGPMGAPVIFPQQPNIPVYHNRALWPFVTAYGLSAATKAKHVAAADEAYKTLIRGAALNLSNMENLEWLSGQAMWLQMDIPAESGPVINSKYQLWSVAAYLNLVIDNVFGLKQEKNKLKFEPFITQYLANRFFQQAKQIQLTNLSYKGKTLDITIKLPTQKLDDKEAGYYSIQQVTLNGVKRDGYIEEGSLLASNEIVITLGQLIASSDSVTLVNALPGEHTPKVYAPLEPSLKLLSDTSKDGTKTLEVIVRDDYADNSNRLHSSDLKLTLYRNGRKTIEDQSIAITTQAKRNLVDVKYIVGEANCYSATIVNQFGNHSHQSYPICVDVYQEINVDDRRFTSNKSVQQPNSNQPYHYVASWGAVDDSAAFNDITIDNQSHVAFQLAYHNDKHVIGQGITSGVKRLVMRDAKGTIVSEGVVQLPHGKAKQGLKPKLYSTPIQAFLPAGVYSIEVQDFFNMSYLTKNQTFTSAGGLTGAENQFDLIGLKISPSF